METATLTSRSWWIMLLRGLLALTFGAVALFWPAGSMIVLVLLFAAYVFVDGIFALLAAIRRDEEGGRLWLLVIEGITGIAIGILTLRMPQVAVGIMLLIFVMLIAAWLIITGITRIVFAIELRRQIAGEWTYILSGAVSLALGLLIFIFPGAGATALIRVVGFVVMLIGIMLVVFAFKLRGYLKQFLAS